MNRIDGKSALITGGGSGIGRATCVLFAQAGANVTVTDVDLEAAEQTAMEISRMGKEAIALELNVASETDWVRAIETTRQRFSQLDILVNNAAVIKTQACKDMTLETWRLMMNINLDGVFLGIRAGLNAMVEDNAAGAIVSVASINGLDSGGAVNASAYCASKAGVRLLSKAVALECAASGNGIRVNCVCPGGMEKSMAHGLSEEEEARKLEARRSTIPLGRCAEANEIAQGILFLVSEDASYITGSDLVIDGAFTAGLAR